MATVQTLMTYASTTLDGAGYENIVQRAFPVRQKYDKLPLVIVCSPRRSNIKIVAFGPHVQQDISLDLVLVNSTTFDNTTLLETTFNQDVINLLFVDAFLSFPFNLPTGVWKVAVSDPREFDPTLLLQGYAGTSSSVTFTTVD